jgi:hypothetical protein
MEIHIPFQPFWEQKLNDGIKTCTSRNRRMGWPEDIFTYRGIRFEITEVFEILLNEVSIIYYKEEGCNTKEEFISIWRSIYHRWEPGRVVFLHRFKKITK